MTETYILSCNSLSKDLQYVLQAKKVELLLFMVTGQVLREIPYQSDLCDFSFHIHPAEALMGVTTRAFSLDQEHLICSEFSLIIVPPCFPVVPQLERGCRWFREEAGEAGLGEHTACACGKGLLHGPESSWAAFPEGCCAWGHRVFSATIIINETFGNAGIPIGVMQLEFCCSAVAPTLELPSAFSRAAFYWVCTVRGGGSPGAVRCSWCASITAKLLTRQGHPHGTRSNNYVTPCCQLGVR